MPQMPQIIWHPGGWDTEAYCLSITPVMSEQSRSLVGACPVSPILFCSNLCAFSHPLQTGLKRLPSHPQDLSSTTPHAHVHTHAGHGESKMPCTVHHTSWCPSVYSSHAAAGPKRPLQGPHTDAGHACVALALTGLNCIASAGDCRTG